ncbi:hypothetical protein GOODEAATRI_033895 [Goodea atripinnis]|uniref:Uncharacterized protein n=1 Tax=Goodea atripinnis TaxID=208336 RepID=A0ABV0NQB9_9TELE
MPAPPELAITTEPLKNIKTRSDITSCCESSSEPALRHSISDGITALYRGYLVIKGVGDSLGVSVAGGKGSPLGDIPIFIAMIQANGVAAKTHRLKNLARPNHVSISAVSVYLNRYKVQLGDHLLFIRLDLEVLQDLPPLFSTVTSW